MYIFYNVVVQTEAIPSNIIDTQIDIQAKDILMRSDPYIANLQENLAQARLRKD